MTSTGLQTADIATTFEELKAKGVPVRRPPTKRPYGIEAIIGDDSGNWFSLTQPYQMGAG